MSKKSFVKGIKNEIKQPIIVLQAGVEVDRFIGVFKHMTTKVRKATGIALNTIPNKQEEAINEFLKERLEHKKSVDAIEDEAAKKAYLKKHKFKSVDDIKVNEADIENIIADHDQMVFDIVSDKLIRCEMIDADDDREWQADTLEQIWGDDETSSAFVHRLTQLCRRQYVKETDTKN